MPLATMNLQTFLYSEDSALPQFQIRDLLQQAANIGNAIKCLHDGLLIKDRSFVCCHMDLKLDNVLVYNDKVDEEEPVGKWKISDFGISTLTEPEELRAEHSETLTVESPAQTLAGWTARMPAARAPAAYQAPEVSRGSYVGRSSDMWSFGCILFQILARGVGPGTQKLVELDKLRAFEEDKVTEHPTDYFFRELGPEKYLNPHVKDWLEEDLPGGSFDTYFVKSCKHLILEILEIDAAQRLKAPEVNDRLLSILKGPKAAHFSEVETQSPPPRRPSRVVTEITITAGKERDNSRATQQTTLDPEFATSATPNGDAALPANPHNTVPPPVGSGQNSFGTSPRTQSADGSGYISQLSNLNNILPSSIESRGSIEPVHYDTTPFTSVKDVVQALISSKTGNIAFITKKAIPIRTTSGPANYFTIKDNNFEWECGSMAGDFLTAVGRDKSSKERVSAVLRSNASALTTLGIPAL